VFGNAVLKRVFGQKIDEMKEDLRKLHNEELHNLYSSRKLIKMIKSRKIKCAGHVVRVGRARMSVGYWWESQKERDH
jgi:hypothetical protein